MTNLPWTLIFNAYGTWTIEGQFKTKREAIETYNNYKGTDCRPNKRGEIGFNDLIIKTKSLAIRGYTN